MHASVTERITERSENMDLFQISTGVQTNQNYKQGEVKNRLYLGNAYYH